MKISNGIYILTLISLLLFGCGKDDDPGKEEFVTRKWKIKSAVQHHYADDKLVESITRYPSASYIEFLPEHIYRSEDLENVQFFALEGNELLNPNYLGGGIWEPVYDFQYLYLDKGLGDHPFFLKINYLDDKEMHLNIEIDEKHFTEPDSSGFKFAFVGGLQSGANILSTSDTTQSDAFDTGYIFGKAYALFQNGNSSDVNPHWGYWSGFYIGYSNYQKGQNPSYDTAFQQGLSTGYNSWKNEATMHDFDRRYSYDLVLTAE